MRPPQVPSSDPRRTAAQRIPLEDIDAEILSRILRSAKRPSVLYQVAKRGLDILVASCALVLTSPLLACIALILGITSGRPIVFRQQRLGQHGCPFTILKFRTMDVQDGTSDARWATAERARVTPFGRWLRRTHLDELPQLLLVLRGTMTLVGPRPIRRVFADRLEQRSSHYKLRFLAKPGLTGWSQLHMGYADSYEGQLRKLEYDLYYLAHSSLCLDLLILRDTIPYLMGTSES